MAEMTHRERVIAAIDRCETDRTPIDFGGTLSTTIVPESYDRLKQHLGLAHETVIGWKRQQLVLPHENILKRFDVDTRPLKLGAYEGGRAKPLGPNTMMDDWGTTWEKAVDGHFIAIDGPFFNSDPDLENSLSYSWPDPENAGLYRNLRETAEVLYNNSDYAVILDLGIGVVTRCQFIRGFMEFLFDLTRNKEFAVFLMERFADVWIRIAQNALKQVGHLVDVVFWGDDYGMQQAPLFRPQLFTDLVKPINQRMISAVRELTEARILLHSCGSVYPMINDLIDIGIHALNPVQVSASNMEPERLKNEFGDRLAFWGGIDTQDVLPFRSPEEVRAEVRHLIEVLGEGGGYVLATVHNIQNGVPPENIVAMFDECLGFRR